MRFIFPIFRCGFSISLEICLPIWICGTVFFCRFFWISSLLLASLPLAQLLILHIILSPPHCNVLTTLWTKCSALQSNQWSSCQVGGGRSCPDGWLVAAGQWSLLGMSTAQWHRVVLKPFWEGGRSRTRQGMSPVCQQTTTPPFGTCFWGWAGCRWGCCDTEFIFQKRMKTSLQCETTALRPNPLQLPWEPMRHLNHNSHYWMKKFTV